MRRGCSRLALAALAAATALLGLAGAGVPLARATPLSGARDAAGTVWLCRPGLAADPCTASLATTVVSSDGARRVENAAPAPAPRIDCFYVYPTISGEPGINADLAIDLRLEEVAIAQASRFSQVCNVYAPVYPQITLAALTHPARITIEDALRAYNGVAAAFRDYLAHDNHGRGIVFIGHSQGAVILTRLLRRLVDGTPLQHRLVSALLLGGNVTVTTGKRSGGAFTHIPACASARETGCVVAYSSFTDKPGPGSDFGLTSSDAGVRLLAPNAAPGLSIMCVNPAAPGGGSGLLEPFIPSLVLSFLPGSSLRVTTPWVSFPAAYRARCEHSGSADWLQVTRIAGAHAGPPLTGLENAALGLHVLDVNIALGNLVALVASQARAYLH